MGSVCEHEFEEEDPRKPGFSLTEYDLYARLDLTLRKNLKLNRYEFMKISTGQLIASFPNLQLTVEEANKLEEAENTIIKCGAGCPRPRSAFGGLAPNSFDEDSRTGDAAMDG